MRWSSNAPRRPCGSLPALPYLQPPVHHVIGTGWHADGLFPLQFHGELGIEPEEVDEFGCSINLCLDHGLALLGRWSSFNDTRQATASPEKGTKTCGGLIMLGPRTEEGKDLVNRHPIRHTLDQKASTDHLAEVRGS